MQTYIFEQAPALEIFHVGVGGERFVVGCKCLLAPAEFEEGIAASLVCAGQVRRDRDSPVIGRQRFPVPAQLEEDMAAIGVGVGMGKGSP